MWKTILVVCLCGCVVTFALCEAFRHALPARQRDGEDLPSAPLLRLIITILMFGFSLGFVLALIALLFGALGRTLEQLPS